NQLRAATWLVRGLRQRARSYEAVVRGIVELRPEIAVIHEPKAVAAVQVKELAARTTLDIDTVRRSASGLRFQTPAVIVAMVLRGESLSFRRG
ncbi:MAG: hypothetical protein ABI867_25460, partial [Kofleriaceae bacterium]